MGSGKRLVSTIPHSPFPIPALLSSSRIAARDRRQDRFENRFLIRGLGFRFGSRRRSVIVERQSSDDASNLNRIERFASEQFVSQTIESVTVLNDDLTRALVL